jgi:hypothetical protein
MSLEKTKEKMNTAWLVQWGFHAQNEDESLKRYGINKRVVDIISVRKSFEDIAELAKDIYGQQIFWLSEKVYFANYSKGVQRKKKFFHTSAPIFTHYQSDLYRDWAKAVSEKDPNREEIKRLNDKLIKYPQYIVVGHNPYLEIIKVFNLSVYQNSNGNEVMEWDRPLPNGSLKKEKYETKNS